MVEKGTSYIRHPPSWIHPKHYLCLPTPDTPSYRDPLQSQVSLQSESLCGLPV